MESRVRHTTGVLHISPSTVIIKKKQPNSIKLPFPMIGDAPPGSTNEIIGVADELKAKLEEL